MLKLLVVTALLLVTGACSTHGTPRSVAVSLHGAHFSTELATTEATRERGLMARRQLASDRGMLFVFADEAPRGFWMKNTPIALDILYFDANRQLVSVQHDVPPCTADPCPIYPSAAPAQYVLEVAAGTARRIDANVGDTLTIQGPIGTPQ